MGRFIGWCPDLGEEEDEGQKITACDAKEAAEEWAEWQDQTSAEYSIVAGNDETVMIRDLDTRALYRFLVRGESIPFYSAKDISNA